MPSFFNKTVAGVLWTGGGRVTKQVIHLTTRLILARLLAPNDFGVVAIATVVIDFTDWIVEMGFGSALIQRKDLTEAHKSTAFWANTFMGWFVFMSLVLIAPVMADFFDSETLTPVLIALSLSVIFNPPRITLESLFARDFHFRLVALRQILSIFLGGITGIGMALNGFGVWALVGQTLVSDFSGTFFIFWQSPWRPKLVFSRQAFMELWSFSMSLTGARLFTYFNRNLDTILIGRFLGAMSLGLYNLGYQLVLLPLIYVTRPVNQVLFITFSKLQDEPERLRNAYLHSLQLTTFVTFPLMTLLALSSPELVPALLGEKWEPATPLFPLLCLVGLVQSVQNLASSIFQATGRTTLIFRWTVILLIGNTCAFTLGLRWGILGVAVAYSVGTFVLSPILFYWLLQVLDLDWFYFIRVLSKVSIPTLILILTWYLTVWLLEDLIIGKLSLFKTFTQIVLAGALYLLTSWWWNPITKETYWRLNRSNLIRRSYLAKSGVK